ncbi:MAG: general secretion pathway protein GspK [Pseudobdellovibrionaceae bacterium]
MKLFQNQKGIALIFVMFTMVIAVYLVTEISYESNVEYIVNANAINRVKAYYAAKSAVDLSLLRIKIYSKINKQFGNQIPPQMQQYIEYIWSFPLLWPLPIDEDAFLVEKEAVKEALEASKMDASYRVAISDEGSKIDINDLGSPVKALRESSEKLIRGIFESRMLQDEEFAQKYRDYNFDELILQIKDWLDADTVSQVGGDESQFYPEASEDNIRFPPNRQFRTLDELRLIPKMNDEIFQLLKDQVTIFGNKGINPNNASVDLLRSLDPSINLEIATEVRKRVTNPAEGGPFRDANDFWQFLSSKGGNVSQETQTSLPLFFENAANFKIEATGTFGTTSRTLVAYVFDPQLVAGKIANASARELKNETDNKNSSSNQKKQGTNNEPLPKGPPRIVYFSER